MTDRLSKACSGKSDRQGGMNLPEIKALAIAAGHSGKGSRDDLLKLICKPKSASPAVSSNLTSNLNLTSTLTLTSTPQDSSRLTTVCSNTSKTTARGGMNLPEIKALAIAAGHSGKGSREELLKVICAKASVKAQASPVKVKAQASPVKAQASPVKAQASPVKAQAQASPVKITTKLPQLPRGQVTINSKYWAENNKPSSQLEREDLMSACGDKCFLIPKELKYPICNKDNTCKVDCHGLRAAYGVAAIQLNSLRLDDTFKQRATVAHNQAIPIGVTQCGWK